MILKIFVDKSKPETPWVMELPNGSHINAKTIFVECGVVCETRGDVGKYYIECNGTYKINQDQTIEILK